MSAIPLRGRRAALRGPAALAAAAALLVTASCADPDHRTEGQPAGRTGVQDEVVVAVTAEPDTHWVYAVHTDHAADGYAHTDARIWHPDGRLVAISRQTVAVFG